MAFERAAFSADVVPSTTVVGDDELIEEKIPTFRRTVALKRRKLLREEIAAAVDNAAPDIDTGPIIDALTNLAREKGWK